MQSLRPAEQSTVSTVLHAITHNALLDIVSDKRYVRSEELAEEECSADAQVGGQKATGISPVALGELPLPSLTVPPS